MNQEASMWLFLTLCMVGDYFTKAIQGSQFRRFLDIVPVIHEDYIPSYNAPGKALFEEQKINLDKEKEEVHKASKLTGE